MVAAGGDHSPVASKNVDGCGHLLARIIVNNVGSTEFYINKAIGWALREYSKTDADWVREFVATHELSRLSQREALKRLGG